MRNNLFSILGFILPIAIFASVVPDPDIFDGSITSESSASESNTKHENQQNHEAQKQESEKQREMQKKQSQAETNQDYKTSGILNSEDFRTKKSSNPSLARDDIASINDKFKISDEAGFGDPAASKINIPPGYPIEQRSQNNGITQKSSSGSLEKQSRNDNQNRGQASWGFKASPGSVINGSEVGNSVPEGL